MSILDETRFLERFQFFNGQRLFASDLQGGDDFNREMRWLHNRSLHQLGIGSGFAVYGKKGDREVVIGAGYAVDVLGREIVLTNTISQQVPPVAGDDDGTPILYDLAVSYPDDAALEETESRDGVCLPRGVVRLREVPVLCWIRLDKEGQPADPRLKQDLLTGMRLTLARAEVLNCQLNKDLSVTERRSARPSCLPYIVSGEESPTNWSLFTVRTLPPAAGGNLTHTSGVGGTIGAFIAPFGLTAQVDASAAGFQVSPFYTARISGERVKSISKLDLIVDGLISIRDQRRSGFTADVLLLMQPLRKAFNEGGEETHVFSTPEGAAGSGEIDSDAAAKILKSFEDWQIVWMGTES